MSEILSKVMSNRYTNTVKIIYEDNHLLVVEKPVNIPSQKDASDDRDMLDILKGYIKEKYNKQGEVFLGLVHRLDRPVGGAMVFARTSKAASRISEQIRLRQFKKEYTAVVHGIPLNRQGTLKDYLKKDTVSNIVSVVLPQTADAKEAILDYNVVASAGGLSLVKVQLHTGRPHQIRVQFAHLGHPLYGDQKYGAKFNKEGMQIALWSTEIRLKHPTLKEEMTFRCEPPDAAPWNLF